MFLMYQRPLFPVPPHKISPGGSELQGEKKEKEGRRSDMLLK